MFMGREKSIKGQGRNNLSGVSYLSLFLLLAVTGPFGASCDQMGDYFSGSESSEKQLSPYEEELKEMSWYDFKKRDYREFTEEDMEPYIREAPERKRSGGGFPVFNPIILLWGLLGAVVVLLLVFLFRNGISFQRTARQVEEDSPDLAFSREEPRKRDPLFDDALKAMEEERYSDVMETLLEILVRFSHAEKYLARRTGFTPREFQRLVRKVAPASFVELADDLSPAFEETVYALRPRSQDYYRELIHRMEKQLQGVGR